MVDTLGEYAVVIGGVNVDIGGSAHEPIVYKDSNPGKVTLSLGGVGRNIAHNMSLLGVNVKLLTAFGDDVYAKRITASCEKLGIDISRALVVEGGETSTYMYLNDHKGDMVLAVSDMEICKCITPEYIAENISLVNNAAAVVVDTNIPEETIKYIAENCTAPIFADPVSTAKAGKLLSVLGKIHTLKPNRLEAELLSGVFITDEKSLKKAADALIRKGMRRVFISLGEDGVYAADSAGGKVYPKNEAQVVSTTGAGDAFMAALVWSYINGWDIDTCACAATAASSVAVESEDTINETMSAEEVYRRMI